MNFNKINNNNSLAGISPVESLLASVSAAKTAKLTGLSGALGAMALASIAGQSDLSVLITADQKRARELAQHITVWLGSQKHRLLCFLPERESVYDHTAADPDVINERLAVLSAESRGGGLVIVPVETLLQRFYEPEKWKSKCFSLTSHQEIERETVVTKLVDAGYRRTSLVEEPGTFAVRGSLIDLFPPDCENPVRLDFFGEELESIKDFVVASQRSVNIRKHIAVVPASEYVPVPDEHEKISAAVAKALKSLPARQAALLERKLEHFNSHADARDYEELKPFVKKAAGNFFAFFSAARVFIEDFDVVFAAIDEARARIDKKYEQVEEVTPLPEPSFYYHDPAFVKQIVSAIEAVEFSRFGKAANDHLARIESHSPPADPSRESFVKEVRALVDKNYAVAVIINDEARFHNLRGLLSDRKVRLFTAIRPFSLKYGSVSFLQGYSRRGFKDSVSRVAVFSEEDIYMGPVKETNKRRHASQKDILAVSQVVPGDIVVHADHGVAEFRGVKTMTAAGNTREYMLLQYAGADKLYVPTDQVHKVSKYIGMEGYTPRIHSLNSKVWAGQKSRVSKNVEAVARELLELYAKRQGSTGFAFSPDCELQKQMEEKFPYVETPDQMRAIIETKNDMQSPTPMDRLVCGDVGYGKTEVAMRAAFKAVCSGRQVALLAPTTLLAFQHYQTFTQRFAGLPVTVDMVSRLRKPAQQKETMKKLAGGTLDVLIGTHRLLSKDFAFSRLGLLIVDEEQRFGVKHKERLKQLKTEIDVLTLTATPIPRTMQMAMSGIRQISIIDTPPTDRKPVQTYVAPFDAGWIKRAIIQELKRGGQIYYVFNRVEKIEQKARSLQELVPEARIVVAHGQMPERQVEKTMLSFINQEFDLLLSTTIIESGLDIPNVNTLIVDEAQMLGLSQMYQLRGRVGRSDRQAWAYFFYGKNKRLTKEATERLETIEEHTALGSGFKIALRDLQIRGAGNILGEAQSGHIASIGFSLYMEMLEDAVDRLKSGRPQAKKIETAVEIPVTAYFPISYIADEETRIELYRRLSRCSDTMMLDLIKEECDDRFGTLPEDSLNLFKISRLRIIAAQAGVKKISRVINHLRFEFADEFLPDLGALMQTDNPLVKDIFVNPADQKALNLNVANEDVAETFFVAEMLLNLLINIRLEASSETE